MLIPECALLSNGSLVANTNSARNQHLRIHAEERLRLPLRYGAKDPRLVLQLGLRHGYHHAALRPVDHLERHLAYLQLPAYPAVFAFAVDHDIRPEPAVFSLARRATQS